MERGIPYPTSAEIKEVMEKHPSITSVLGEKSNVIASDEAIILLAQDRLPEPTEVETNIYQKFADEFKTTLAEIGLNETEINIVLRQLVMKFMLFLSVKILTRGLKKALDKCGCEDCKCEKSSTMVDKDGNLI
ncbi:MAG: hypothetical protein UR43_C0033G0006 [candidate division TM6 bacterium GW2011_GWF2_33_332]|nr:MAG: hypothetical protein UR43_C0033G0006 [candidate division TM6 bacterium GW2011_GWF2_33_332]